MQKNELNEELNRLLEGTHMGAAIFKDLLEKLQGETLIYEFHRILDIFRMHERSLTAFIMTNDGDAADSAGMKGTLAVMMEKVSNLIVHNDADILKKAIENMEAALKAIHIFAEEHVMLDADIKKVIMIMQEDYESIYHNLKKYLIEYTY